MEIKNLVEIDSLWNYNDSASSEIIFKNYISKAENYNSRNEVFRDFLIRMIKTGKLSPEEIKRYHKNFYN